MAKKLMEVIEMTKDLKNSTTKIKLLDTSFSQLTRKIGQNDFGHWLTIGEGEVLSKEALVSLNNAQLKYLPRYVALFQAYNDWIDSVKSKLPLISNFIYNFSALYDYSSSYVPYVTPADYYLLKDFIGAEKEIYEAGTFWMEQHMQDVLVEMKRVSNNYDEHYTIDHPTIGYMMTRVIDDKKVYGMYRRGDQFKYLTDTYHIGICDARALIKLTIASQPEGSHHGNNTSTDRSYTYVEIRDPDTDELLNTYSYKHYTIIGGDNKVNFTNRVLVDLDFDTPVRVLVRFDLYLGYYDAHMDSERYATSVIKWVTLNWQVE